MYGFFLAEAEAYVQEILAFAVAARAVGVAAGELGVGGGATLMVGEGVGVGLDESVGLGLFVTLGLWLGLVIVGESLDGGGAHPAMVAIAAIDSPPKKPRRVTPE